MAPSGGVERQWAKLGAQARLIAIEQERQAILKVFPDLRRAGTVSLANGTIGHRPKRQFSAAAKRRMSAGMRRYWARRKAKADAKKTA